MASRFLRSCTPFGVTASSVPLLHKVWYASKLALMTGVFLLLPSDASPQALLKPSASGQPLNLNPSDMEIFESDQIRRDLPCSVTPSKPELGFDLRFHAGYNVAIPLKELEGSEDVLTILFRIYPEETKAHPAYFVQHVRVPSIEEDAKGDVSLHGIVDLGEGRYHVDWLVRDRSERSCSSSWDYDATLPQKDKQIALFIAPNQIQQTVQPFTNENAAGATSLARHSADDKSAPVSNSDNQLSVKLLVNFAPQKQDSAALRRSDTDALVTILKTIQRDPHMDHISLVAFNMDENRVVYRQDSSGPIDFLALGHALETMKLGTVSVQHLDKKSSEAEFLENLIKKEVVTGPHPDAYIFAGPKTMLNADVPPEELRRIANIETPMFYMNYNLDPQAVPWKDSIGHAVRIFKGTEYTISRPRDLWFSTSDILDQILRSKQQHAVSRTLDMGGSR